MRGARPMANKLISVMVWLLAYAFFVSGAIYYLVGKGEIGVACFFIGAAIGSAINAIRAAKEGDKEVGDVMLKRR